jgi:hypothetical protein
MIPKVTELFFHKRRYQSKPIWYLCVKPDRRVSNFNVMKRYMVVGLRPERPVKKFREVMPFYETRHIINRLHRLGHRSIIPMEQRLMTA